MDQVLKIKDKVRKIRFFGENISFFWFGRERARGRGREKSKTSFGDPQSSVGRNSLSKELKFIASTRATCTYQKEGGFTKDPKKKIWGNQRFWA